jgi:hypothetical protein
VGNLPPRQPDLQREVNCERNDEDGGDELHVGGGVNHFARMPARSS